MIFSADSSSNCMYSITISQVHSDCRKMVRISLLLLLLGLTLSEPKMRYDNYKVLRAVPHTNEAIESLRTFVKDNPSVIFWKYPSRPGSNADIMVPPNKLEELTHFLSKNGIDSTESISNVQELIAMESVGMGGSCKFDWARYHTLDEIYKWLNSLAENYPAVSLMNFGTTYEGRNLTGVYVSYSPNNTDKAVFIESNIHAREWISAAVSTYILNELLSSTDPTIRKLAESYDWYVLPVANPDGFVYTHTENRLWRKTREPHGSCFGTDPNRNWDSHWSEFGTSPDPCSEEYPGTAPFSAVSVKSLSENLSKIGNKLVAYIDFHSYSQLLMVPYGYSPLPLDNYNLTYNIGLKAADSLSKRYGTKYTVGNIYNTVYPASGDSLDWVKATFETPLAYVYELRDTGRYGFLLPPDQIIPSGQETLDSIVTIFEEYEKHK